MYKYFAQCRTNTVSEVTCCMIVESVVYIPFNFDCFSGNFEILIKKKKWENFYLQSNISLLLKNALNTSFVLSINVNWSGVRVQFWTLRGFSPNNFSCLNTSILVFVKERCKIILWTFEELFLFIKWTPWGSVYEESSS